MPGVGGSCMRYLLLFLEGVITFILPCITSIPMTVFVDREGYIVRSVTGAVDRETLQSGISLIE